MKNPRSTKPAPSTGAPAGAAPEPAGTTTRAGHRRWFRAVALAAPFALLLGGEWLLRLIGFGYPTEFFLRTTLDGQSVFIENQAFSRRYFPPGLERTPQPILFPAQKPAGGIRVFVFGESAALGDPEPAFGFPRQLEVLLAGALPQRPVEVIPVALTAINSHVLRDLAGDATDKSADFWILYLGNNEVVGPYGAGTVFGDQVPALPFIRANLTLKTTRTGQFLDALRWRIAKPAAAPARWEGMEMFLHQQVTAQDPRLERTYEHFAANVRQIIALGRGAQARVLVGTVAANLRDCAPFASVHRPDLSPDRLAEYTRLKEAGLGHLDGGRLAEAVQSFIQAAAIDDQPAEIHYALGRTLLALGQTEKAREAFHRALEQDALRFRPVARINDILRASARQSPDTLLVDVAARLAEASPAGLPGEEWLYEHVHFNPEGNHAVARAFATAILETLDAGPAGSVTNRPTNAAATSASARLPGTNDCFAALALTPFDRHRVLDEMRVRLELPPFNRQIDHAARLARLRRQLETTRNASLEESVAQYRKAIAQRPNDWVLHENFATLLRDFERFDEALEEWKKTGQRVPHSVDAWLGLADTLDAMGRPGEAIPWYRRALVARPASPETRNGLALALAGAGDAAGAQRELERALRDRPDFAEARVNLGRLLAQAGRTNDAMAQYREAIRSNSNNVAARINLGKLQAAAGQSAAAVAEYQEALRVKPDHAIAHFNLANALSSLGDRPGALRHYGEAARLNPRLAEARYQYGLALTRENRNAEALAEFDESTRLDPGFAPGHFNRGVALAKSGRFAEAASAFETVLRLDPGNTQAQRFLDQARSRAAAPRQETQR